MLNFSINLLHSLAVSIEAVRPKVYNVFAINNK